MPDEREKRYIVISCEGFLEDIQLETLRPSQRLNIFGLISIPFGVESEGKVRCKVKEVILKSSQKVENELGELEITAGIDEGKHYSEVKMSEDLPKNLKDRLGIGLIPIG